MKGCARGACTLALALLTSTAACKRPQRTLTPGTWDDLTSAGLQVDPRGYAPQWDVQAVTLANGLVVHAMHEASHAGVHARLLVPREAALGYAVQRAAVDAAAAALRTRLSELGQATARVHVDEALGRFELALWTHAHDVEPALAALAQTLVTPAPTWAREVHTHRTHLQGSETLALEVLQARLRGAPLANDNIDLASAAVRHKRWSALFAPSRTALALHHGLSQQVLSQALAPLGAGALPRQPPAPLLARMHGATAATTPAPTHLLATPPTPVLRIQPQQPGKHVVMVVGRTLPVSTPQARALARLAQRIVQEELDARLEVVGDVAWLLVRVQTSPAPAGKALTRMTDQLSALALTRHPQQRLTQAAHIWLGARMVQASLHHEDWTELWSQSLDLATTDNAVAAALAQDAHAMLAATADELSSFMKQWFDPRAGEPGWSAIALGEGSDLDRSLQQVAPLEKI